MMHMEIYSKTNARAELNVLLFRLHMEAFRFRSSIIIGSDWQHEAHS